MINMFSHMACICHFVFLCPAQSLLWVYLVWVHSHCSLEVLLIFLQLFRCRNLALNRVFSYFLVAGMFYYLGGVWMPHICTPLCLYASCMFVDSQGCTHPHMPHTLLCICVFLEALHVVGGCNGSPLHWDTSLTPPLFGGASSSVTPPTLSCWFSVHWYVSGISVCYVGISLLLKGLGVFSPSVGGLRASSLEMSISSFLYIFCSALCLMFQLRLRLLLLWLQWYLLACHQ